MRSTSSVGWRYAKSYSTFAFPTAKNLYDELSESNEVTISRRFCLTPRLSWEPAKSYELVSCKERRDKGDPLKVSLLEGFGAKVSDFEGVGEVADASSCTRHEKSALRE